MALEVCGAGALAALPGGGAVVAIPLVDMSPAKADTESRPVKANVSAKRFMTVFSFKVGDARFLTSNTIEQHPGSSCKLPGGPLLSVAEVARFLTLTSKG
jgi:hypothetical protein